MSVRDNRKFNNIRHSNCAKRRKKREMSRMLLLAMAAVVLLLALVLATFGVCALVQGIKNRQGQENPNIGDPSSVRFKEATLANTQANVGELVLVNKDHSYPDNLSGLSSLVENRAQADSNNVYGLVYQADTESFTPRLQKAALDAFNAMMLEHYRIFSDSSVIISSAYRAYSHQVKINSTIEAGHSDHHTGYTVALRQYVPQEDKIVDLPLSHWIYSNCHKYGFIMRYPGDKFAETGVSDYNNCFRYVGIPHAYYISNAGICLEEYVTLLRGYNSAKPLSISMPDGKNYLVYYTALGENGITSIKLPENYSYTISGDNVGGFIITVDLSSPIPTA